MNLDKLSLTNKRLSICQKLGLNNNDDILSYYPFRYELLDEVRYEDFKENQKVVFYGELISYPSTFRKGRLSTTRFKVLYDEQEIAVTIFNRPWVKSIGLNEKLTIIGTYNGNNKVTASNYYAKKMTGSIIPTYSLKEDISQNDIKTLINYTLTKCEDSLIDRLPSDFIEKHQLMSYKQAIINIHKPLNSELLKKAISRLKYEEFLRFYVALKILKGNTINKYKDAKIFDVDKVNEFIESFNFVLTADQKKASDDILNDLSSKALMYRLLQGEVGSGKTAIAMIGLYANYLAGYQGALMAPTEILAKQHYESLVKQFSKYGIKIALLYSEQSNKEIKEAIKNNEYDIVVGTHALFSKDVEYHNLGLVIADEQHRFGVKQRQALKDKGDKVDFLLMSATPIPRTLASSIYGDMDISTIETMPLNRKGCKTFVINKNSIIDIKDELIKYLNEGRQMYIIAAAIEKNENYNAKDLKSLYDSLIDVFKPYKLGLLHGRLSSEEKESIMDDFNNNKIQVLVSTTVVEVGVNVANATVMVIYDADKFGLSQIHQLRGRVQRSNIEGRCYLLSDSKDENVLNRLDVLEKTNDGFKISYEDLKLRGPGDILGTRQSGVPAFILGNLIEDTKFINGAKLDAETLINNIDNNEEYYKYYASIEQMANNNYIG